MNNFNLNLFKYFYYVVYYNGFTNASKNLNIAQSSLSYNIKQLELYNSAFIANGLNKLISIKSYRSHLVLINLDKLTILELIKSDVIFTLSLNNIQSIITDKYTLKSIPRQYHKFIVDYH